MRTVYDIDRDTEARRHLWTGLGRMSDKARISFLQWACKQVLGPDRIAEVKVTDSTGTVHEVYMDLMQLAVVHDLDLGLTCERMERVLRRV